MSSSRTEKDFDSVFAGAVGSVLHVYLYSKSVKTFLLFKSFACLNRRISVDIQTKQMTTLFSRLLNNYGGFCVLNKEPRTSKFVFNILSFYLV